MNRRIVSFHEDSESQWIAELSCGHRRHTRHDPPLSDRPWVLSSEGREARIGLELDCIPCDEKTIPRGFEPYRRTGVFDQETVPKGLLERHTTKPGIWARIHVTRGVIDYLLHAPFHSRERLDPNSAGIVPPEVEHHLETSGPVTFYVEFWRRGQD